MAVVDSLLRLIAAQGADGLLFVPGQPPALDKGGTVRPLSMPDPGPEFIAAILDETLPPAEHERLARDAGVETTYVADGVEYFVRVATGSAGPRVSFRLQPDPPAADPVASEPTPAAPRPAAIPVAAPAMPAAPAPEAARAEAAWAPVPLDAGVLAPLLQRADDDNASDILLSSGRAPRLRIDGELVTAQGPALDDATILAFVSPAMSDAHRAELQRSGSVDLAIGVTGRHPSRTYRANLFRQQGGLGLALRPIRRDLPTLARLHLPPELVTLAHFRSGLVLVTGTTGSGKSTTLVALIEHLNQTSSKHIITLEDPIEYEYEARQSLIHQRQVGHHVDSFGSGLRAALRETPDVILVGEMRDHATISAALTAAETGHLVLSTLHTASCAMAIDRIIDVFPEHQQAQVRFQLSAVLRAVLTQRLVPGAQGRVPIIELLRVNTAVATKIRDGRGHQLQSEIQKGRAEGMITQEASVAEHVRAGRLDRRTALEHVDEPALLQQHLATRGV
jgi:twitching motility protein PilT